MSTDNINLLGDGFCVNTSLDFMVVIGTIMKNGRWKLEPDFCVERHDDLMIRGGDFYAIWVESRGLWSLDEFEAIQLIDRELDKVASQISEKVGGGIRVMHLKQSSNKMINRWHSFCRDQMPDSYHTVDEKLTFSNTVVTKKDYVSKRLPYPLEPGDMPYYEKLISTLYFEEERHKIEWAIGSIVSGDSTHIQKFLVLYGAAGTGKSTILNIIQKLFVGYYSVFDAKALGSASNSFALESFVSDPLVAIQHDGDLSRIEDNTRLNSLVSHELMTVNVKNKSAYASSFKAFLFMGTNKPVKITDGRSGLIRRLIDVTPSGNKLETREYDDAVSKVEFELGAIAYHCLQVYLEDPKYYSHYKPSNMMAASNDMYNFVMDSYYTFKREDGVKLSTAWEMYKAYCEEAKCIQLPRRIFIEELKNYFMEYKDRFSMEDGSRVRSYFQGFKYRDFEDNDEKKNSEYIEHQIKFEQIPSIFDKECSDCPAQYADEKDIPTSGWDYVKTKLASLDTSKVHYVRVPENHIVIDFDIPDEAGNKSFEKNLAAASKWPPTYAELSKSGQGIHLHYIYTGDPTKLSRIYDDHIEVKVFTGKSSLRRKLTKCNNLPISTISSGLPLKGEKMVNFDNVMSENGIRTLIKRNLAKEIHPGTKPSIDFIYKILEDAYTSGLKYDVSDMQNAVIAFAAKSTHQAEYCLKVTAKMHFKADDILEGVPTKGKRKAFFDIEVFPNLLVVNWKLEGEGNPIIRMINPDPSEIEDLMKYDLIGFNCRRYDNHLIYARMLGYNNEQLYNLSQRIINGEKAAFFGEAYNVSYTDIYDFASAGNKKSLKKLEIEMSIHHLELGLPWDQPVPENLWTKVAEYCDNDVIATEAAFNYLHADWTARQILADLAGMTVNDTTNSLTTRIIFGKNRNPQNTFCYRNLAEPVMELDPEVEDFLRMACPEMMEERYGEAQSLLPYFPGYEFRNGKSYYRGEEFGEGGYVHSEPGIYGNVALLDIASMHPHSVIAECLFGPKYTVAFRDIVEGRVSIKHEDWDEVNNMLDGKLTPYIQKVIDGEMTSKQLADALKTAINSVYGLTSAKFDNPFRDRRNIDNIVAKRGELFMIDLKNEVQKRGFIVAHIKTDSIKIPDATPEIIEFVMEFGKKYGYTFEHEATYDRMCLVNKAVYIAKYRDGKHAGEWTATGDQFKVPYVFKKMFSHEEIEFKDLCETFAVSKGDLYLDFNEGLPDVTAEEKQFTKLEQMYKKGLISDITFEQDCKVLREKIAQGHNYLFVGRVGQFCPVVDGCNGGVLYRKADNKYYAAAGSTGYRWKESEVVKELGQQDLINRGYYDKLVNDAIEEICLYGDYTWFTSDDPYEGPEFVPGEEMSYPVYPTSLPWKE